MRYARDYGEFQRGRTRTTPVLGPYGWRRDRAEDDPSLLELHWDHADREVRR